MKMGNMAKKQQFNETAKNSLVALQQQENPTPNFQSQI